VRRRAFITLLSGAAAAWPLSARTQQSGNSATIGLLWPGDAPPASPRMESFRQGLRALGLVDGQNVAIELRYAQRGPEQLPELAAELIRLKVDVIFASGDLAPKVAQQATDTIPIVAISDDILGAGVIASLSRPGGNTTGLTILSPELSAKRLEVLRDMIPGLSRITALWDPTTGASQVTMTASAALSLNLKLQVLEVRRREEVAAAVRAARSSQADALNVFSRFLRRCTGRSSPSRRNTGFQQSISGRNTSRPGVRVLWAQSCGDLAAVRDHRGQGAQGC
jgi:putative tryptophan/tyrosine transport system substrate-binding protein